MVWQRGRESAKFSATSTSGKVGELKYKRYAFISRSEHLIVNHLIEWQHASKSVSHLEALIIRKFLQCKFNLQVDNHLNQTAHWLSADTVLAGWLSALLTDP